MMEPVLSVADLRVSFGSAGSWTTVVHGVSFDVHAGSTVALVGESGSGKSVTALSIMRLLPDETCRIEGTIAFNGRRLLDLSEREMESVRGNQVAMIFQEPMTSLNPTMPVGRQIAEALMAHSLMSRNAAKKAAIRLLERVRIPAATARYDDFPHLLSGGMRQRVMIAMALACKPKLLIADEPTTALDVTVQAQILDLLRDLQAEEGLGILFITHDMGVVAEIADRMVVMLRGRTVEHGETAEVFASPSHAYTRRLLAAVPKIGSSRPAAPPAAGTAKGEPAAPTATAVPRSPILAVRDLSKLFDIRKGLLNRLQGRVHAVDGVSFTIERGETLALVGESGCGKSTTGRCIAGLIQPSSGSIMLDGQEMVAAGAAAMAGMRRRMQMVFQDPYSSLNPRMRIGESIAEPLVVEGSRPQVAIRERVGDLLKAVGLDAEMRDRFPHEFSGGQRQRICIARALALEPELIVADEAVSALDVTIKTQIINLLLDLQQKLNLSLLFISHDMAVVERISHRVAVMYLGEIVEIGDRESLFGNPQHPYTQRLLAAVPVADPGRRGKLRRIELADPKSPIRPVDYHPVPRRYQHVGPHHKVRIWDANWEGALSD